MNEALANGIVAFCGVAALAMGVVVWWLENMSGKRDDVQKNQKTEMNEMKSDKEDKE